MAKYYIAIPIVIGVLAGMFAVSYFGGEQKHGDFSKQDLVQNGSPYEGNPESAITIVEFGDYQCTYCHKFHQSSLDTIKKEYIQTGKANLVFRDFPLNGPDSILAAEASHCAGDQGRFWEYHDALYENWAGENTGWVTRDSLSKFAQSTGIDLNQFNSCLDSAKHKQQVLDTYTFGQKIGINATPSFLIISGDKIVKITGNQPIDVFRKTLDSL
ncbi:MAG TPA: thioredoxin domain-containing protein [Candidatus Nitrosotenuis sp.]|nr:thioredoxin domain-containing protein [Candidatus Nitrosotenuis sp.]